MTLSHRSLITLLLATLLAACQTGAAAPLATTPTVRVTSAVVTTRSPTNQDLTGPATQAARTPIASPLPPTLTPTPTTPPITTLLFTGIIVPARCVQAKLDADGNPNYPYEEVQEIIAKADLSIGTFNATMSDRVEHTGCWRTYQLVGSPDNADALAWAGFDVMSVATNHIKDCGAMKSWCDYAMFDTLDNLRRVGIQTVGAGANLDEALKPVVITANGVRFGFVSLGDSKMDWSGFASEERPGVAMLTEENMRRAMAEARQIADVVIALPHWGSEDNLLPNWWQREQALYTVAAGADLVVGNHTHVIQAFHYLFDSIRSQDVPVFYSLGNFIFDQGLRDHRQSVLLLVRFQGTHFLDYQLIPIHTDADGRAHLADAEETAEILQRLELANDLLE